MRISDWSSDVCSSDLHVEVLAGLQRHGDAGHEPDLPAPQAGAVHHRVRRNAAVLGLDAGDATIGLGDAGDLAVLDDGDAVLPRSEEHTSELQSLMRISYAVFCLKKKKKQTRITT